MSNAWLNLSARAAAAAAVILLLLVGAVVAGLVPGPTSLFAAEEGSCSTDSTIPGTDNTIPGQTTDQTVPCSDPSGTTSTTEGETTSSTEAEETTPSSSGSTSASTEVTQPSSTSGATTTPPTTEAPTPDDAPDDGAPDEGAMSAGEVRAALAQFRTALQTWERCMAGGSASCGAPPALADYGLDEEAIDSLSSRLQQRVAAVSAQAARRISCNEGGNAVAECISPQRSGNGDHRATTTTGRSSEESTQGSDSSETGRRRPIRPGGR